MIIRYLPDICSVDLGAQYVYPESVGCIYDLEWPYVLMGNERYEWHEYRTYDSSGSRVCNDMEEKLRDILYNQVFNI